MKTTFRVGILGATGAVGQKFVELLAGHPWFEVVAVIASARSAGKTYREAVYWTGQAQMPEAVSDLIVGGITDSVDLDFVFSGLDASVAGEAEGDFASRGIPVISNAKNYRMHKDVPLLIPEVNPEHTRLIEKQRWTNGGFIVTNPNCSTICLVAAVKPLQDVFGIEALHITTMQAISGAGYPGVPALDILGNVIPFIGGEEEKIESEPLKLLGRISDEGVVPLEIPISAQCNRVPVIDGHLISISARLSGSPTVEAVREAILEFKSPIEGLELPSDTGEFIRLFDDDRYPQPARQSTLGNGMVVSVGRLRRCPILGTRMVALAHNTVRGAAGGAILNAELLIRQGYIKTR